MTSHETQELAFIVQYMCKVTVMYSGTILQHVYTQQHKLPINKKKKIFKIYVHLYKQTLNKTDTHTAKHKIIMEQTKLLRTAVNLYCWTILCVVKW